MRMGIEREGVEGGNVKLCIVSGRGWLGGAIKLHASLDACGAFPDSAKLPLMELSLQVGYL